MDATEGEAGGQASLLSGTVILVFLSIFTKCQASSPFEAMNAGEGVEKREPSYTVGGNAN